MNSPVSAETSSRRWLRWIAEGAVVLMVLFGLQAWMTRDVVRGRLPALVGELVWSGQTAPEQSVEQWRARNGGDAFVLYVWASWCAICKSIEANVDAVAQGNQLLTIAMQSGDATAVARFLSNRNAQWPTLIDSDARLSGQLGVRAVPTLLFVDRKGRVRSVTTGYTSTAGIRLRLWWASLAA